MKNTIERKYITIYCINFVDSYGMSEKKIHLLICGGKPFV
jgi:hypothetical protein